MTQYKNILTKEFWENLFTVGMKTPTTLEAQHRGQTFVSHQVAESHQLKADEIDAIRQTQSKGFRVIDIDPNALSKEEYFCCYDDADLSNILGAPVNGWGVPGMQIDSLVPTQNGSPRPYWRTFQCDVPGNFLKIEFLPARTTCGGIIPTSSEENPVSIVPQNTNYLSNTDQFVGLAEDAGRRTMLLDFEKPSNSPIIVKDGSVYKTYFSGFYLTFKQLNVRIRITIGFNSEIDEKKEKETSLHLFGGKGVTSESPIHPIPFCFTHRDVGQTIALRGLSITSEENTYINLLYNPKYHEAGVAPRDVGLGVFFLTGFEMGLQEDIGVSETSSSNFEMELLHVKLNANWQSVAYTIRRFATITVGNKGGGNSRGVAQISEPIRVTLRPDEALVARCFLYNSRGGYTSFNIRGYSFGNFIGTQTMAGPIRHAPFQIRTFFKEHPFPQDLDTCDMPRR